MAEEDEIPVAILIYFEKPKPRLSKSALWILLDRYGLNGR